MDYLVIDRIPRPTVAGGLNNFPGEGVSLDRDNDLLVPKEVRPRDGRRRRITIHLYRCRLWILLPD